MWSTIFWTVGLCVAAWIVLCWCYGTYLNAHPQQNPARKAVDEGFALQLAEQEARAKYGPVMERVDREVLLELLREGDHKQR